MKISVRWLNEYLDPANVTAEGAESVLTQAGFPIETAVELSNGDVMLDVEVTSNRGDCLSHIGLAREIAAATGRRLRMPKVPIPPANGRSGDGMNGASPANGGPDSVSAICQLDNRVPDVCRLFTARVIRGVKVKRSPPWLVEALEAVGQRPINNIVDVTNYVAFEYGQPSHVFDLARLRPGPDGVMKVVVRSSVRGEKLTLLDGRTVELAGDELVVADAKGPVSLAGIMGGASTQVTEQTVDVLLEAATWDPVTVRTAARRLGIRTEASFRFERTVDPRTIDGAARRAAALIVELGGGSPEGKPGAVGARLVQGVLQAGAAPEPLTRVSMRIARARAVLGVAVPTGEMIKALRGHEVQISLAGGTEETSGATEDDRRRLDCTIPPFRPDLTREIDLIEEVARTLGLARIPVHDSLSVRIAPAQTSEKAKGVLGEVLTGLGFFEAVTFSFVSHAAAEPFMAAGSTPLVLCDERRKADPVLRPSLLPSLLACRRANQDGGVHAPGGVRLYEVASVYAEVPPSKGAGRVSGERRVLAMTADAVLPEGQASAKAIDLKQGALRLIRGALDSVVRALGGPKAVLELRPTAAPAHPPGFDPAAAADVMLNGKAIGAAGLIHPAIERAYDLHAHIGAAEVDVDALLALYPPRIQVQELPAFPGIERDLSFVVDERVRWADIDGLIAASRLERLDGWEFVTTFRGPQVGAGKKSVTVRLRFRDSARTLRHEEVDPQVGALVTRASDGLGATLRA